MGDKIVEIYIVNIYKRERESNMIVGIVEKVGAADKQSFQTAEGLLALLNADGDRDRRREGRLKLRLPVTIEGVSHKGDYFCEKTTLEDLSPGGARFTLKQRTDIGQNVLMIIKRGQIPVELRGVVIRCTDRSDHCEVGMNITVVNDEGSTVIPE